MPVQSLKTTPLFVGYLPVASAVLAGTQSGQVLYARWNTAERAASRLTFGQTSTPACTIRRLSAR